MKVIFIDVDGVCNNQRWLHDVYTSYGVDPQSSVFEQRAMFLLRQLVDWTGAKLVLCSSWRVSEFAREIVADNFSLYGLNIYSITGQEDGCRGNQIAAWLARHDNVDSYVILDDDDDMGPCMDHLVQTDTLTGLLPGHIRDAYEILMQGAIEYE